MKGTTSEESSFHMNIAENLVGPRPKKVPLPKSAPPLVSGKPATRNQRHSQRHQHATPASLPSTPLLHHRNQTPPIIPTRFPANPRRQIPPEPLPIRPLDVLQMGSIPIRAHHPRDQQLVLGAEPLHRLLEVNRIAHDAITSRPHHLHERLAHVAGELGLEHFLEGEVVFGLVGVGDGADGAVAAGGEEGADGELVGAEAGLGGAVELGDVGLDLLRQDGRGVFLAGGGQDHGEEAGRFAGEVGAHVGGEGAGEGFLVGGFDGVQVGVGASEEDVVEEVFVGADAFEGFVDVLHVLVEGAAQDGEESELEIAGGFAGDVGFEDSVVALVVDLF